MKAVARIMSPAALVAWRKTAGAGPVAVVTGTFDLLHPGNLHILRQARETAETVVVVVEPDRVAARHAGPGRPQNHLETRVEMAAHLRDVAAVTCLEPDVASGVLGNLAPFAWIRPEAPQEGNPYEEALMAKAGRVVEVTPLAGCFTADILQAMAEHRTPLRLPPGWTETSSRQSVGSQQGGAVTVNGCFDILHVGHLRFLEQARAMGGALTVLINSDASVARYKGPSRPVFPEAFRRSALCALRQVDGVIVFNDDNPLGEIARLRPAIHVKGGSYEEDRVRQERDLVESWGGRLVCTPMVDGFSTTAFIRKALGP